MDAADPGATDNDCSRLLPVIAVTEGGGHRYIVRAVIMTACSIGR